jgi:hypothetical protein
MPHRARHTSSGGQTFPEARPPSEGTVVSFQRHMRSGNQLPSCCLCGQTEKGVHR